MHRHDSGDFSLVVREKRFSASRRKGAQISKPVSLTGGATSYLLQPYLLPGGFGMAFYSCHFFLSNDLLAQVC